MLKGAETCGIGKNPANTYWFVVERYFEDSISAAESSYAGLQRSPKLPK